MKAARLVVAVLMVAGLAACEGPTGPVGPQGPQGEQGPVGAAGADGSVIHAGNGAPAAALGNPGDFYLDLGAGDLYGPKHATNGWGTPISLKGPEGEAGADGSQIFAGATPPDPSLGQPGDYYLNTTTYDLYGPKTNAGWGDPINLQGPPGTANVLYSEWTAFVGTDWSAAFSFFGQTRREYIIEEAAINADLLAGGMVMVYIRLSGTTAHVQPLPVIGPITKTSTPQVLNYRLESESIVLVLHDLDGVANPGTIGGGNLYRYVVIPGGTPVGLSPDDLHDYEAVREFYGIPD
jgi:hypothetical protein